VEAIKEMVGAGLGCAILPGMAVQHARHRKRLMVRSLSPKLQRKLALVIRRDKPLFRGVRETMNALRQLSAQAA
jgi:DNA-binding transcriptional LysR family regulator